jgi:predicted O-methyltransferase YrrM
MNQAGVTPLVSTPRRWDVIASFMTTQGYKTFVEVGCKEGRTTGHILKAIPDARVIAIDPWCAMPAQKGVKGGETYEEWDFAKIEATFWENVGDAKDRCTMLKTTSYKAANGVFPDVGAMCEKRFDIAFIDAAHDYESVKKDIRLWWPLIREGGMLVGHDWNHKWPGVERAVADSFDLLRVGVTVDSVWFVLKTGDTDVFA